MNITTNWKYNIKSKDSEPMKQALEWGKMMSSQTHRDYMEWVINYDSPPEIKASVGRLYSYLSECHNNYSNSEKYMTKNFPLFMSEVKYARDIGTKHWNRKKGQVYGWIRRITKGHKLFLANVVVEAIMLFNFEEVSKVIAMGVLDKYMTKDMYQVIRNSMQTTDFELSGMKVEPFVTSGLSIDRVRKMGLSKMRQTFTHMVETTKTEKSLEFVEFPAQRRAEYLK